MAEAKTTRRGIFSWMLYDWAAQPYHTLLITFVFAPYFTAHVAANPVEGQQLWGLAGGIAGIVIALLAPVLGAMADISGPRKPYIAGFSALAIIGAALLYFALPWPDANIPLILAAFAIALIGLEFATVFTNAMMPGLVSRAELGKLSGSGWALGYVGGIVALIIVLGLMSANPESGKTLLGLSPIFGLDPQTHAGDRASGPLSAIWLLVFIIPLFLFTPDAPAISGKRLEVRAALAKLWSTIKTLPARRSYFAFLISSMIYRDGLNALYAFGGIYAAGVLGLSIIQIGIFGIVAAIAGALGAFVGGRLDSRYGPRRVVFWCCWLLAVSCAIIVSTTPQSVMFVLPVTNPSTPLIVFYIAGALIGAGGGALQAASRTLLVDQVEDHEVTEAFGLYALTGRATSFIGPLSIAIITGMTQSQRIGITPVVVLLAIGAIGLSWVSARKA
jgi:UMF1 family MFS transporter